MPYSNQYQITIEKSPQYMIDERAAERAYQFNPKLKIVVILRDPVIRAVSEFVHLKWETWIKLDFAASNHAYLNESQRFQAMLYVNSSRELRTSWDLVRNGLYFEQLKYWLKYFPLEQILFINGEQLIKEPSVEIDKLQSFLNLKPLIKKEHFVYNIRKGFPCIVNPLNSKHVKCMSEKKGLLQKGREHPKIDQVILNDLKTYYRHSNQILFNIINQKPWWPL